MTSLFYFVVFGDYFTTVVLSTAGVTTVSTLVVESQGVVHSSFLAVLLQADNVIIIKTLKIANSFFITFSLFIFYLPYKIV